MISKDKGKQVQVTSYYDPEVIQRLKALSESTRIPQAAYLREALGDLLAKHGWRKMIPGCFGSMDVTFGLHPLDKERAKAAIKVAKAAAATFEDFERELVLHCHKEAPAWRAPHTVKQVAAAKKLWGK